MDDLYRIFQNQRQKVMVFSKLLSKNDLQKYIDPTLYDMVDLPQFTSLTELISRLKNDNNSPLVVEFGMKLMK